jgi:antitoxin VapB
MGIVDSRTFRSGNSTAVRLPKEVAFAPDTRVTIERNGDVLTIRLAVDPAEEKRKLRGLIDTLRAIGRAGEVEERDPIAFPDRPDLY